MNKPRQRNNRRDFLKESAAAAAGLGCLSLGLKGQHVSIRHSPQDTPGTHNMLVFGEQTAFLSHLPMFVKLNDSKTEFVTLHRYQVILETTFTDGTKNLTEIYTADRKANPKEKMYTINPARFVLPDLDTAGVALKTFRGNTIFRGHLERPSTPIIGSGSPVGGAFDVNVQRVVHFRKFLPGAAKPTNLEYILFGKGSETFMAHLIAQPPDFDQIISVKVIGPMFTPDELSKGMNVSFPKITNTPNTRIKEKQKVSGLLQISGSADTRALQIEVLREFYFEEGELRMPDDMEPTAEEQKSGFGV